MGVSTDAILIFGVLIPEGGEDYILAEHLYEKDWFPGDIGIVLHCSFGCPMYAVAVKSLTKKANRGYPVEVGDAGFHISGDVLKTAQFELNCFLTQEKFSDETTSQKPKVWLMSF